jgi:hypothetical protein
MSDAHDHEDAIHFGHQRDRVYHRQQRRSVDDHQLDLS